MAWYDNLNPFTAIAKVVAAPINEWQKMKTLEVAQKDKKDDREHEIRIIKATNATELAKQGIQIEADWDRNAQEDMKTSWKDEYLMVLFSIPLIGAFIPSLQDAVLEGFNTLDKTPDWYILMITGIVAATFGLRWLLGRNK